MAQIVLDIDDVYYALFLQKIKKLRYIKVIKSTPLPKQRFDFSDLVGKLEWKGNALLEQRKMRDEW
ncbi:MAG: hypothetical protein IT259_08020 [Saprospiraceae bacterium]|nr:hypothetical protein [Saprospiraceae bacterium]